MPVLVFPVQKPLGAPVSMHCPVGTALVKWGCGAGSEHLDLRTEYGPYVSDDRLAAEGYSCSAHACNCSAIHVMCAAAPLDLASLQGTSARVLACASPDGGQCRFPCQGADQAPANCSAAIEAKAAAPCGPTCYHGGGHLQPLSSRFCGAGWVRIGSPALCEATAYALGLRWGARGNYSAAPRGCHWVRGDGQQHAVRWNLHPRGSSSNTTGPVCRTGFVLAPACTPARYAQGLCDGGRPKHRDSGSRGITDPRLCAIAAGAPGVGAARPGNAGFIAELHRADRPVGCYASTSDSQASSGRRQTYFNWHPTGGPTPDTQVIDAWPGLPIDKACPPDYPHLDTGDPNGTGHVCWESRWAFEGGWACPAACGPGNATQCTAAADTRALCRIQPHSRTAQPPSPDAEGYVLVIVGVVVGVGLALTVCACASAGYQRSKHGEVRLRPLFCPWLASPQVRRSTTDCRRPRQVCVAADDTSDTTVTYYQSSNMALWHSGTTSFDPSEHPVPIPLGKDVYELTGHFLGQGSFGLVQQGVSSTGKFVALKGLHAAGLEEEIAILRSLSHPNIVRCNGSTTIEHVCYIVMEFVSGGTVGGVIAQMGA